jgi:ankyrin repeat protein
VIYGTDPVFQGGMDVNITTDDGNYTPIHTTTLRNDLTSLKALFQDDDDVNIKTSDGFTSLDIAQKNKFIPAAVLCVCRTSESAKLWSELVLGSSADSVLK